RRAAGVPEVQPFLPAMPAFGQVEGEVSPAVAGGAGGDVDQVAADGRCAGLRVQGAGQGARRADQVLRHGGDDPPGGIRVENTGRKMSERPVVPVREDLLYDRVVAVLALGLGSLETASR